MRFSLLLRLYKGQKSTTHSHNSHFRLFRIFFIAVSYADHRGLSSLKIWREMANYYRSYGHIRARPSHIPFEAWALRFDRPLQYSISIACMIIRVLLISILVIVIQQNTYTHVMYTLHAFYQGTIDYDHVHDSHVVYQCPAHTQQSIGPYSILLVIHVLL